MSASAPSVAARPLWRRLLRAALIITLVVLLLVSLSTLWLLKSGSGRDFALARVVAALPADTLSWRAAEGALAGPLILHDVRYREGDIEVHLARVEIDLAPSALIGRTVEIERLLLQSGVVRLAPADAEPSPWPEQIVLPQSLPTISLPFTLSVAELALRDIRIEQGDVVLGTLRSVDAKGRFERGRIALQQLDVDSDLIVLHARGDFDTASRWNSTLDAEVVLPATAQPELPLTIALRGDTQDLTLSITAQLRQPALAELRVTGGLAQPTWTLKVTAPQVDAARLGLEGEPIALQLQASGTLREATIASGRFAQGERIVRIEPSTLGYGGGRFSLAPLAIALDPGTISARGEVDLRGDAPTVALALDWSDVALPAGADGNAVLASGTARVEGPLADYAIELDGTVLRGRDAAAITLRGRGDESRMELATLGVRTARGGVDGKGSVAWSPQLAWSLDATLRDFDPSYFLADFPGAIDATLTTSGEGSDAGVSGELHVASLGGQLRDRALAGRLDASIAADGSGQGELDVRIGESHVDGGGRWGESIDVRLRLSPLHLQDVDPGMAGTLTGTVHASGARDAPDVEAELRGAALVIAGTSVGTLAIDAQILAAERGALRIEGTDLLLASQRFATFSLEADGARAQHALRLALGGDVVAIDLAASGGERDGRWRGTLGTLRLAPKDREVWNLRAPAELAYDHAPQKLQLAESCLDAPPATLCAALDWSDAGGEARFSLQQLALAQLDPLLTAALDTPLSAYGSVSASGTARRAADGTVTGEFTLQSPQGGLRVDPESPRELLVYRTLRIDGGIEGGRAQLRANAELAQGGSLVAEFQTAQIDAADGELSGRIDASVRDLTFIELLSDQLVEPVGRIDAALAIDGTRSSPALSGRADLKDFGGELPGLGLTLTSGNVSLQSRGTRAADISGSVVSGDGTLTVDGRFDLAADAEEILSLDLRGENVRAAAIPELAATISPDVQLRLVGDLLRVRGKVAVPSARIELEQLQSATAPSTDVVVVDAGSEAGSDGLRIDSDVSVELGDDVRLNGFGLKAKLDGRIAVRDRPGRATVARGGIEVTGEYKAYGQDLSITRGRLAFASTPVDNPALDIRAQREIDEVTVGVQVRGTALAPELTLWSDPALDQAEQLSYLVLGRPLRSASQADGAQLSQAAAAIGGNFLAKRLGARMGLDEVGVADSRALGGAALTVGKFLSPKLYVSYGVALFGTGQVVTFKYILSRIWSVQIDSGTENRAALNYRLER